MVQNHVTTQVPEVGVMVHAALGRGTLSCGVNWIIMKQQNNFG